MKERDWADDEAERLFDITLEDDVSNGRVVDEIAKSLRVASSKFHSWDEDRVVSVAAGCVWVWAVTYGGKEPRILYACPAKELPTGWTTW